jgi:hypothetical protein
MPTPRKRSEDRLSHTNPDDPPMYEVAPATAALKDFCPFEHDDSNPEWHPIAQRWYDSLFVSEQAAMYARSDVAHIELAAHLLSDQLYADRWSAMAMHEIVGMMDNALTSVGARLQRRVETIKKTTPERSRGQIAREQIVAQFSPRSA